MTVIETDRLILRRPRESDMAALISGLNNFNVSRWTSRIRHPYGEPDAAAFIAHAHADAPGALRLSITRDGVVIGGIGYEPADTAEAEFGYWLAEPEWGKGYATEAGRATVDHFFSSGSDEQLIARYRNDNPASGRVLAKLGFEADGDCSCASKAECGAHAASRVRLTRARWQALQASARNAS